MLSFVNIFKEDETKSVNVELKTCKCVSTSGGWSMPIAGLINCDYEYLRIMRELQKYGVTPTKNKELDKAKLNEIKDKEIQAELIVEQRIESHRDDSYERRKQLEELKIGAMTLAEINRVLHGL